MRRRIFLVDQSAEKIGGHYLEYLLRLEAAISSMFDVYLIGNQRARFEDMKKRRFAHYRYSFLEFPYKTHIRAAVISRNKFRKLLKRFNKEVIFNYAKNYVLLFRVSNLRARNESLGHFSNQRTSVSFTLLQLPFIASILLLIFPLLLIFSVLYKSFRFLVSRTFINIPAKSFFGIYLKSYKYKLRNDVLSLKTKHFKKDTIKLIERFNITNQDMMFFSTVSFHEIKGIVQAFSETQVNPKVIIILRRGPEEFFSEKSDWRFLGNLVANFDFNFYSDTLNLATIYSKLLNREVRVFPIPAGLQSLSKDYAKPLTYAISYLGDARSEKRFDEFVELGENLLLRGKRIFCQANQSGTPSTTISAAINRITRVTPSGDFSIKPLTPEHYLKVVKDSEVIFVDYEPEKYRDRSSGVFTEAISAGANVVVSNGSWMHKELDVLNKKYFESFQYTLQRIPKTKVLPSLDRGIYRFVGKDQEAIELLFELNTGIKLYVTGWFDDLGVCYTPTPLLNPSETILSVKTAENQGITICGWAKIKKTSPLRLVGATTNNSARSILAFDELEKFKATFYRFRKSQNSFERFHTDQSMLKELGRYL